MRRAVVGAAIVHVAVLIFGPMGVELKHCYKDFCKQVVCNPISPSQCNGKVVPKASDCGCCDYCVKQLDEGEICFSLTQFGMARWGECREGLKCNQTISRCDKNLTRPLL